MKKSKTGRVPAWVLSHLKRYGNCAIGRRSQKNSEMNYCPSYEKRVTIVSSSRSIIAGKEKAERPISSDAYAET